MGKIARQIFDNITMQPLYNYILKIEGYLKHVLPDNNIISGPVQT